MYIDGLAVEDVIRYFNEVVLDKFWVPTGNKVNYTGDPVADIVDSASRLLTNVTTNSFTLSFNVSSAAFALPEGRTRMYLEKISATKSSSKCPIFFATQLSSPSSNGRIFNLS